MNLIAVRRRPSGFISPSYYEEQVTIIDFVYGGHQDGGGYDRRKDTVLAVFINEHGDISHAPADQFNVGIKCRAAPTSEAGR